MNVKIVTLDVKKNWKFAGSSHPNRTGKQAAKKVNKKWIKFKKNMVEKLQKAEGENKGLTKNINNMRAVITT